MRLRIPLILLACVLLSCARSSPVERPFTGAPAELQEDLQLLRSALEEGHPALDRYARPGALDSAFTAAEARVKAPMSRPSFHVLLGEVVGTIRDGHTSVNLPKATQDSLDLMALAPPFRPVLLGDTMYVLQNYSDMPDSVLLGARVDSINGQPVAEILGNLARVVSRDGSNETRLRRMLERPRFLMRYLAIVQGARDSFRVVLASRGGQDHRSVTLPALTYEELHERAGQRYPEKAGRPPAALDMTRPDGVAVLRISDFDKDNLKSGGVDFPRFLDESFARLSASGTRALVLDLRGNRGGTDEFGGRVAAHLIPHDFVYYAGLEMRAQSYAFFDHTTNARGRKAPGGFSRPNDHGTFDVVKHPNLGVRHPARNVFQGALVVLIDGGCFSTTSELLSALAENTDARFVGEESGGAFGGNCSGPTPTLLLPNSKLRVDIPLVRYSMAVSGDRPVDRGILPDVEVTPSLEALLAGRDPVLEAGSALAGTTSR